MFSLRRKPAPDPEPVVSPRDLREADTAVAEQLYAIHLLLDAWAGRPKNWALVDALLDERLFLRPPDAMQTRRPRVPVIPGRPS